MHRPLNCLHFTTATLLFFLCSAQASIAATNNIFSSQSQAQKTPASEADTVIFAKRGWKVAQEQKVPNAPASSILNVAGFHLQQGEYPRVIDLTEQAIKELQNNQQLETEAAALVMQSLAYFGKGNSQRAFELAEKGLAISREVKRPTIEAFALIVLSLIESEAGNSKNALELINKSRDIARQQKNLDLDAFVLEVTGEIYREAEQTQQAIAAYQASLSLKDTYSAKAGLARVYQDEGKLETAILTYKQAINKNEEQVRKFIPGVPEWLQESFPKAVQDITGLGAIAVSRTLTNLLISQNRMAEAQQVLELAKGQELREYTGKNTPGSPTQKVIASPAEDKILAEYGSFINFGYRLDECQQTRCSELPQLLAKRKSLTEPYYQALQQLETELRKNRNSDPAFVDPNELAQKAKEIVDAQPGTVLIYPLVLKDQILLLWTSKGGVFTSATIPNIPESQVEVTVMRFRHLLQNRRSNIDELKTTSKQLYDWFVKPLEAELKANKIQHLVFAQDRSTRYIPMSTLFDGEKYLIENYTLSSVLSANLTNNSKPQANGKVANIISTSKNQNNIILGVGLSDAVAGFQPLPYVTTELDLIVRQNQSDAQGIFPGKKFLNQAFNLATLRENLPGRLLLHIATHSVFVPGRADQSYMLLGTGEKLLVPEIESSLNLQSLNLVVLSACETALGGPGLDGKEIAGIGYYFLKGGANTVVASLWRVDDLSTRVLMEEFYKNLASPVTKAEALRQAQLVLLNGKNIKPIAQQAQNTTPNAENRSLRHPYYWAPFILMGSGL
jgi:CHAT domain-containing protein